MQYICTTHSYFFVFYLAIRQRIELRDTNFGMMKTRKVERRITSFLFYSFNKVVFIYHIEWYKNFVMNEKDRMMTDYPRHALWRWSWSCTILHDDDDDDELYTKQDFKYLKMGFVIIIITYWFTLSMPILNFRIEYFV